jgi:hypothetical protein
MTVDNVTQVLNKIPGDKWEEVMGGVGGLDIPWQLLMEIKRRYSTDTEKNHACADYYVNCHPDAEWEHLTWKLYDKKESASARESKSFMSTGEHTIPLHTCSMATDVLYYTDLNCSYDKAIGTTAALIFLRYPVCDAFYIATGMNLCDFV